MSNTWKCGCPKDRCSCHTGTINAQRILHNGEFPCPVCGVNDGNPHHYGCTEEICPICNKHLFIEKEVNGIKRIIPCRCGTYVSYRNFT